MKKTLIALAVLAAAGAASAQSSVQLFGIVDATWAHGSGSTSSKTQLTNSGISSSQLGVKGIEDLGGGMKAGFWLEAAVANDNGQGSATNSNNQATGTSAATAGTQGLVFQRRSTVSLGGTWGEIRLGRDYTPHFWNHTIYDPFGTNGVGTNQIQNSAVAGFTQVRASNSIAYEYGGNFNQGSHQYGVQGFTANVMYYMGENASSAANSGDGNGWSARLSYAAAPFSVAYAYASTKYNTLANTVTGTRRTSNLGADYDFGVVKLMAEYDRDTVENGNGGGNSMAGTGYLVGGVIPMGAGVFKLAYSRYKTDAATTPTSKKYALGYVHNLSKRTALYATYAHVGNSGAAAQALNGATTAAGASSSGYDFGIRHNF